MGYRLTSPVLKALCVASKACFATELETEDRYVLSYLRREDNFGFLVIHHNGATHDLGLCEVEYAGIKVLLWHKENNRTPAAIARAVCKAFGLHDVFYLMLSDAELVDKEIGWIDNDMPFWYANGVLEIGPHL